MAYFAASIDRPDTNRDFARSLQLDYPILSDPGKDVTRAYGVLGPLGAFAKRWTFYIGPDGRILHIDDDIHTKQAGSDVAATLARLGVPRR